MGFWAAVPQVATTNKIAAPPYFQPGVQFWWYIHVNDKSTFVCHQLNSELAISVAYDS